MIFVFWWSTLNEYITREWKIYIIFQFNDWKSKNIKEILYLFILDVDPQRDDDASPMSTYRWDLLECWFQPFSTIQIQFWTFLKKKSWFPWWSTREDLSIDVSITNVGLILTKPGRFLFSAYGNSGYGQNSISSISNFLEKFTFLGFHGKVLLKTIPLMYQLPM